MFINKQTTQSALDAAIENAHAELVGHDAHSPEYAKVVDQIAKLYEIKASMEKHNRISKDTLAIVLGNLAGIVLIVGYEQKHIVTSKALNFVGKFAR